MAGRRIYIREASEILDRRMGTLRKLESTGEMPASLRPARGDKGWRYWDEDQIRALARWFSKRTPGAALREYRPDEDAKAAARARMRRPRGSRD
jgi:hypothetical protein